MKASMGRSTSLVVCSRKVPHTMVTNPLASVSSCGAHAGRAQGQAFAAQS
jgi:hypothetical protein